MPLYVDSPELKLIGDRVVAAHHPKLKDVKIGYLFRETAPVSKGRVTFGMTVRVDDRNYVYGGKDVLIEIGQDTWSLLDDELRTILIDHELHHIGVELDEAQNLVLAPNGRPKVSINPHDIEEFSNILDRYGDTHARFRKVMEEANAGKATGGSDNEP